MADNHGYDVNYVISIIDPTIIIMEMQEFLFNVKLKTPKCNTFLHISIEKDTFSNTDVFPLCRTISKLDVTTAVLHAKTVIV